MMTFYHIVDIDCFFRVVNACEGDILLQTREGEYLDIRGNALVERLPALAGGRRGVERLDLYATCADDRARLLRYRMERRCESAVRYRNGNKNSKCMKNSVAVACRKDADTVSDYFLPLL